MDNLDKYKKHVKWIRKNESEKYISNEDKNILIKILICEGYKMYLKNFSKIFSKEKLQNEISNAKSVWYTIYDDITKESYEMAKHKLSLLLIFSHKYRTIKYDPATEIKSRIDRQLTIINLLKLNNKLFICDLSEKNS